MTRQFSLPNVEGGWSFQKQPRPYVLRAVKVQLEASTATPAYPLLTVFWGGVAVVYQFTGPGVDNSNPHSVTFCAATGEQRNTSGAIYTTVEIPKDLIIVPEMELVFLGVDLAAGDLVTNNSVLIDEL